MFKFLFLCHVAIADVSLGKCKVIEEEYDKRLEKLVDRNYIANYTRPNGDITSYRFGVLNIPRVHMRHPYRPIPPRLALPQKFAGRG